MEKLSPKSETTSLKIILWPFEPCMSNTFLSQHFIRLKYRLGSMDHDTTKSLCQRDRHVPEDPCDVSKASHAVNWKLKCPVVFCHTMNIETPFKLFTSCDELPGLQLCSVVTNSFTPDCSRGVWNIRWEVLRFLQHVWFFGQIPVKYKTEQGRAALGFDAVSPTHSSFFVCQFSPWVEHISIARGFSCARLRVSWKERQ